MKKLLTLLLALAMCLSLVSCNSGVRDLTRILPSETNLLKNTLARSDEQYKAAHLSAGESTGTATYPLNCAVPSVKCAVEVPDHLDSLEVGTILLLDGMVSGTGTGELGSVTVPLMCLETDKGPIYIWNMYDYISSEPSYGDIVAALDADGSDYTSFPSVGEAAQVYAIYSGILDDAGDPMFFYGANETLASELLLGAQEADSEEAPWGAIVFVLIPVLLFLGWRHFRKLDRTLKQEDAAARASQSQRMLHREQAEQLRLHSKFWNIINDTTLAEIDQLDGDTFESYTFILMSVLGYANVRKTQASNDYGIDVICEKDGVRYGIQCKRYQGSVGREAVQQVHSGLNHYGCDKGVVITNSTFTRNAYTLARENGITLIDRRGLSDLIRQCQAMGREARAPIPAPAQASPAVKPSRPSQHPTPPPYDRSRDWSDLSQGLRPVLLPAGRYAVGLDIPSGSVRLTGTGAPCQVRLIAPNGQSERGSQTVTPESGWCTIVQHGEILEIGAPGVERSKASAVRVS